MTIKENINFKLEWSISKEMYDNIGDDISLIIQRDNHKNVIYQYVFDICTVNKNINTIDSGIFIIMPG